MVCLSLIICVAVRLQLIPNSFLSHDLVMHELSCLVFGNLFLLLRRDSQKSCRCTHSCTHMQRKRTVLRPGLSCYTALHFKSETSLTIGPSALFLSL
ncbi:hypothetical protein EUGRSUZ_G02622 [Eucalyptus grandis]|uniref:Uncharacterized protein n=2 Tax=Eucalyptus grandis TaxID=71139 RepID=A0ACC3K6X0_EUCGR|nr:hypothetical protein EUGRSUZ_G02622 [Eucalyptus grandis]